LAPQQESIEMSIEEKYQDVLQNIETAIVCEYRLDPNLSDYDVADALKALIRLYRGQQDGKTFTLPKLAERPSLVCESVRTMCEWRLGRDVDGKKIPATVEPITLGIMVDCLRRIDKSVQRWHKQGGRQGYLKFINHFINK
jgi:hypothetical protein